MMYLQVTRTYTLLCLVLSFIHLGYARIAREGEHRERTYIPESSPQCSQKCEICHQAFSLVDDIDLVHHKWRQQHSSGTVMHCNDNADYIHPCNATTRECLVKATQDAIPEFTKGIPELGIESLDPFFVKNISIPLSGLQVTFYQGRASGFRNCIVDNVISELEKRHFVMEFHCNLTIKGQYEAVGKILLFPINGEGDAKIKLTNLRMKIIIKTEYTKDDKGVDYFGIKNYKYTFNYGDRVIFDLKNLFKESKELSNTVLQFLNENWKTVAEEFGKPIVDFAVDLAMKTIEKFFKAVPYSELINVPLPK